jgi:NAD(P)-dependent dehydrogenase (short-subunit alcohol dehydrogenase family)
MKELMGRVAVITGGASGFGRELAILCAAEGMDVVIADINVDGLLETVNLMRTQRRVVTVQCDVSDPQSVEHLARHTYDTLGACHLLFNNAGVGTVGPTWGATLDEWKWVLGINVMGVVHGIRSFVPRMLQQGTPGHVVNTASAAGLVTGAGLSVLCASKHSIVAISECLHHELRDERTQIGVSVLCPAFVHTGIMDSSRNRPTGFTDKNPLAEPYEQRITQAIESGKLSAADVAGITVAAVKEGRFYILTHPKIKVPLEVRMHDILQNRVPTPMGA